jgi:hypothetical protein
MAEHRHLEDGAVVGAVFLLAPHEQPGARLAPFGLNAKASVGTYKPAATTPPPKPASMSARSDGMLGKMTSGADRPSGTSAPAPIEAMSG